METQHYLTSGILEAYLLGLVADEEKEELERVLATDPEIAAQLRELELVMEDHFIRNAVPPPPATREKIELLISETEVQKWEPPKQKAHNRKATEAPSNEPSYVQVEVDDTHIRVHKYWRPAFIAVFVLSKIFLILGLYYYFKANSLEQEINRLKSTPEQTAPLSTGQPK